VAGGEKRKSGGGNEVVKVKGKTLFRANQGSEDMGEVVKGEMIKRAAV
jgi:hypothetical protein